MREISYPDWLFLDKKNKELFDKLVDKHSKASIFAGREMWEVFIFAMSIGYKENLKEPLKTKVKTIPSSAIRDNDRVMWLIKAIAVDEKGTDILMNPDKVYSIAEEYANGGIKLLYEKVLNVTLGATELHLESDALKMIGKLD